MSKAYEFLKKAGVFYLATVDEDGQPRVRPFGAVAEFEGRLYLVTNNRKAVYRQLIAEPRAELSAMSGGRWIRVTGTLREDTHREARVAMMEENGEALGRMYSVDDGIMTVFFFETATAVTCSFTEEPTTETL